MKPNLDELLADAGVPKAEEVLLAELHKVKAENYALKNKLRDARGQLKQVRRELNKRIREEKKKKKQHYRNGQKRGNNTKFHG
jgi:ribosome recycling factor